MNFLHVIVAIRVYKKFNHMWLASNLDASLQESYNNSFESIGNVWGEFVFQVGTLLQEQMVGNLRVKIGFLIFFEKLGGIQNFVN